MGSKSQPTTDDLLALTKDVIHPFFQIYRATPLRFTPERYENDAEHSWSLTLLACALAHEIDNGLDLGKVAQFATVHDVVEIHAGDITNFASDAEQATKAVRELAALNQLKKDLVAFPWICGTIETYERQDTEEAVFVKSVDKLLPLLFDIIEEGGIYEDRKITQGEWKRLMLKQREKASKHSGAFKYYDELWNLLMANPQFFHQANGETRTVEGH